MTAIGNYAFQNSAIGSVTIPEGITSIGFGAFQGSKITSATLPSGLTNIENGVFSDCASLASIDIPEDLTSLSTNMFKGCTSLASITGAEGITGVGQSAFSGCTALTSISLPSCTTFGSDAFSGCTFLTTVSVAADANIGEAFSGCPITDLKLGNVQLVENGMTIVDGTLTNYSSSVAAVTVPARVTSIASEAFKGNTIITSVTFVTGSQLASIGENAFRECTALTSVSGIPDGTIIGKSTFYGCTSLKTIDLSNVSAIGANAFYGCSALTDVSLGDGVVVKANAFYGCTSIQSVSVPVGAEFGDNLFQGCTGITTLSIASGATITDQMFSGCTGLTALDIPDGVAVGDSAFSKCTGLESIELGNDVSLGDNAFYGCTAVNQLTIGIINDCGSTPFAKVGMNGGTTVVVDGPTSITNRMFAEFPGLGSIIISETVTEIGDSAFMDCTNLKKVFIPDSVRTIGASAFHGCTGLQLLMVGDGVESVSPLFNSTASGLVIVSTNDSNGELVGAFRSGSDKIIVAGPKDMFDDNVLPLYTMDDGNPFTLVMNEELATSGITSTVVYLKEGVPCDGSVSDLPTEPGMYSAAVTLSVDGFELEYETEPVSIGDGPAYSLTITADRESILAGEEAVLTITESGKTSDASLNYAANGITYDGGDTTVTVKPGTETTYSITVSGTNNGLRINQTVEVTISVSPPYKITFVEDGETVYTGFAAHGSEYTGIIPEIGLEPPRGYTYSWAVVSEGSYDYWYPSIAVNSDLEVTAKLFLTGVDVSIDVVSSGGVTQMVASYVINADIDGEVTPTYTWAFNGDILEETGDRIESKGPGTYMVGVQFVYNGVLGGGYDVLEYRPGTTGSDGDVPVYDINNSGDEVGGTTVTSGKVVFESSGSHDDVQINVNFSYGNTEIKMELNSSVGSGLVSVSVDTLDSSYVESNIPEGVTGEAVKDAVGVDITLSNVSNIGMIMRIPIDVTGGSYIGSAVAYFIDGEDYILVDSWIQGNTLCFYTTHNTEYLVIPLTYSDTPRNDPDPDFSGAEEPSPGPSYPSDDDDYYPFHPTVSGDTGDDSVTIVACAAAAVVAALMAVFQVLTYRID